METIQFVGACIGYTVSAITLITLIVKPIRNKLIGWIKGVNSTDTTAETLQKIETRLKELEDKIDKIGQGSQANLRNDILQLVDVCIAKGFITSLEKRSSFSPSTTVLFSVSTRITYIGCGNARPRPFLCPTV